MKINGNFYTSNGGQASTFTQTGGTINETGSYLYLSNGGGATAANFSGGVFTSTVGTVLGIRANVTATISGTAAVTLPYLQLGYSSSVDSVVVDILSLNGGTLAVGYVSNGAGTANFNFNGGTLRASGSNASFMTGLSNAYIQGGGATIDSQAYNITIGQALLTSGGTDGGLTKLGAGTLTLSGANTYVGGTTINGGTLVFSGVGSGYNNGNIVIANSANLSILASASSSSFGKSISGTAGTVSFNAYGNTTDSGGGDGGNFTLSNAGTFTGTVVVNTGLIAPSARQRLRQRGQRDWTQRPQRRQRRPGGHHQPRPAQHPLHPAHHRRWQQYLPRLRLANLHDRRRHQRPGQLRQDRWRYRETHRRQHLQRHHAWAAAPCTCSIVWPSRTVRSPPAAAISTRRLRPTPSRWAAWPGPRTSLCRTTPARPIRWP